MLWRPGLCFRLKLLRHSCALRALLYCPPALCQFLPWASCFDFSCLVIMGELLFVTSQALLTFTKLLSGALQEVALFLR